MPIRSTNPGQAEATWQPGKKSEGGDTYADQSRSSGGGGGTSGGAGTGHTYGVTSGGAGTEAAPPPEMHKSWTPAIVGAVVVGAAAFFFGAPLLLGLVGVAAGGVVGRLLTKEQVQP